MIINNDWVVNLKESMENCAKEKSNFIKVMEALEAGKAVLIDGRVFKMVEFARLVDGVKLNPSTFFSCIEINDYLAKKFDRFHTTEITSLLDKKEINFTVLE